MVNLPVSQEKSPGRGRGFNQPRGGGRLVLRDDRAAELVVQADEAHVDVLLDAKGVAGNGDVLVAQEEVVVLDANRPVRRKADFQTCADRAAGHVEGVKLVADDRRTALHIEQDVVPGIADLASEQAKRVEASTQAES